MSTTRPSRQPITVAHVITDVRTGGAQMMLYRLLSVMDRDRFRSYVLTLEDEGEVRARIEALGVDVSTIGMRSGRATPADLWRLTQDLRRRQPDVVQTWMYHADLMGGLAARFAETRAVAWNIRHSDLRPDVIKRSTRTVAWVNARLSSVVPQAIVCCAESALETHADIGFRRDKMLVIHNGWTIPDIDREDARSVLREELGLDIDAVLIGRVGRFHPQKDHRTFIRAASIVLREHPSAAIVLCGEDVGWESGELVAMVRAHGIEDRTYLLGTRHDVLRLTAGLDVAVSSSSFGEGHPGVVGEAMATGVPVVTTDVGDSALLVDGTGWVVPPEDPPALAAAVGEVLSLSPAERHRWGESGRERIEQHFSLERMARRYESLYERLAAG